VKISLNDLLDLLTNDLLDNELSEIIPHIEALIFASENQSVIDKLTISVRCQWLFTGKYQCFYMWYDFR